MGGMTQDGLYRMSGQRDLAKDEEISRLRVTILDALACLDASLFTNAEHSQAKSILRNVAPETQSTPKGG
ncbi:MAG: hypothetical protein WBC93_19605 [Sulfitobacter sp.]